MSYHDLSDSGMGADARRSEASRIMEILDPILSDRIPTKTEQEFLARMREQDTAVSTKQLFWLRDLKEKYL